jgi:hypothetical protein
MSQVKYMNGLLFIVLALWVSVMMCSLFTMLMQQLCPWMSELCADRVCLCNGPFYNLLQALITCGCTSPRPVYSRGMQQACNTTSLQPAPTYTPAGSRAASARCP